MIGGAALALSMGVVCALCWGGLDFLIGTIGRKIGALRTVLCSQVTGFAVLTAMLLGWAPTRALALATPVAGWLAGVAAALGVTGGSLLLSRALTLGQAARVAPLLATYGAVATALSVASGERPDLLGGLGLLCCVAGAPLVALSREAAHALPTPRAAVIYALLSALGNGCGFWLEGRMALPALGPVAALWVLYATGTCAAGGALIAARQSRQSRLSVSPAMQDARLSSVWPLLAGAAALNLGAYAAFALGAASGRVAVVTSASTLACPVTVLLGVALRRERLSVPQWLGSAAVVVGVMLLRRA